MSRNIFLYIIIICAAVSCMSSCDKNAHEKELHGVSAYLIFDDDLDASQTKVNGGCLWIYKADGGLVKEYSYKETKELSSQRFELSAGSYFFVSAINLNLPLAYKNQNKMETLVFYTTISDLLSEQAFYSTVQVEVGENEYQLVALPLKRILSELTIKIEGVPSGARLNAKVYEPAEGILPACKDAEGVFGQPVAEVIPEVALPESLEKEGTSVVESVRLMPTAQGRNCSKLGLFLTVADGDTFVCDVEAPQMKSAGKYELVLLYKDLKPHLRVSAFKITDWKYGWTIDGEILNPNN